MLEKVRLLINTLPIKPDATKEITPFNKELFRDPRVDLGNTPLPLTRLPELGAYNDNLDWLNEHVKKYFFTSGNTGKNKLREWHTLAMTPQEIRPGNIEKPDLTRAREMIALDELNNLGKRESEGSRYSGDASRIVQQLEDLQEIGDQLVANQFTVSVSFKGIPEMLCRRTEVISPRNQGKDKPLVAYLGGIGNDPRSEDPAVQEIALHGRDVTGIGYVDAQTGIVNPKFADQVASSPVLDAHAEVAKAIVRKMIEANPGRQIELWGQSTGALVWATALNDPEFSKLIEGVVFIHPAGVADVTNQEGAFVAQIKTLFKRSKRMPLYNYVLSLKDRTGLPDDQAIIDANVLLRRQIWGYVEQRTSKDFSDLFVSAQVANPKKKLTLIGALDIVTEGIRSIHTLKKSGDVLEDEYGDHQDINTMVDVVMKMIFDFLKQRDDET